MRAFFEGKAYEGLHHCDHTVGPILQTLPPLERQPAGLDPDVVGADGAFEHLDRRVVRSREFLYDDWNIGQVTGYLKTFVERDDGLRRDGCAKGRDVTASCAAFEPVDACPLAHVVTVGCSAVE